MKFVTSIYTVRLQCFSFVYEVGLASLSCGVTFGFCKFQRDEKDVVD